jgi:tRNA dimethylallyltransferase
MQLLAELFAEKDMVILCGGSGLYIDAVCKGFDEVPKANEATRNYLAELYNTEGIVTLQQMLQEKDPEYFQQVDLNNPQRMMRALEVCLTTSLPYSSFRKATVKTRPFEILKIALNTDRAILYERINIRVDAMMNDGLLKEAEALYPFRKNNALQTVGYEELFQYFEAKHTLAEAVNLIKQNTRHYAKRQLTWFNKDKTYHWLQPHELKNAVALIEKTLQP